ncbi:MAG: outer membrane protein transport protein [Pseudomonadota bacterium]
MTSALKRSVLATAVATLVAAPAYATNGMNMEAYGAKAGGMGGASMAYDSGNSAMMNNPATLALKREGWDVGVGLTLLQPNVETRLGGPGGMGFASGGDSYLMPSFSLVRKQGPFAYGIGVLAQGGMGTEYDGSLTAALTSMMSGGAFSLNQPQRSELGFMRVMLPLAYQVNDSLAVAGQLDYVRATLDLQMLDPNSGAYVNVSDSSDFNGRMKGDGFAFKLGAHYKINKAFALGATYHSKTHISDLTGNGTCLSMSIPGCDGQTSIPYRVADFQWPETYAVGMAWNVTDKFMLAADIKRLMWSKTMKTFNFGPDGNVGSMDQNWDDQTVYMIGGQYMVAPGVALRAGFNYAKNPIPSDTVNYLFPAITEKHYTVGVGWNIGGGHSLAASFMYAPEVEQAGTGPMNTGMSVSHSQTVWRVNYNYHF